MYNSIKLLHIIAVSIFLIIYLLKAIMLVGNKKEGLAKFSKLIKVPEMIISFLFLASGIYMLVKAGHPELYMMVKIVLVIASIPLAIIGIKKDKKILLVLSVLILLYVYGIAETKSLTFSRPDMSGIILNVEDDNYQILEHGNAIYLQYCMRCHGMEGNKMREEAPDLTKSVLNEEERWDVIKKGKGIMPAFGQKLDKNEKEALEAFLNSIVIN